MNRDENLTRVQGLPPAVSKVAGRRFLAPSEPGGGTWIGLNEYGVTLALINWYSVKRKVSGKTVSRGEIIRAAAAADDDARVDTTLQRLPLKRIRPFRLIGIFPRGHSIIEWRWDLKCIAKKKHLWSSNQWISSGWDEPAAQRVRSQTFQRALQQKSAGTLDWLRRLHRSHAPDCGPSSTCMHRSDAATVSYTEIAVGLRSATMRYHAGAPCQHEAWGGNTQQWLAVH